MTTIENFKEMSVNFERIHTSEHYMHTWMSHTVCVCGSHQLSVFGGSAWEWREERRQYYLHSFVIQQADLNYNSPFLVEEMKVSENWAHISSNVLFVTLHI